MSYSFSVNAPTKAEVKQKIVEEFDSVVKSQPIHKKDRDASIACGQAMVETLTEPPPGDEIRVSMHGSLGWRDTDQVEFTQASVSVNAAHYKTK